jgi:hypothetical protein
MSAAINLSEAALALLRLRLSGEETEITDGNRAAYRELAAAGVMISVHTFAKGDESAYRFTEEGWARRFELTSSTPSPSPAEFPPRRQ